MDFGSLATALGLIPTRCWKAGDRRTTPSGALLEGTYEASYCSFDLPIQDYNDLADWLHQAIAFLTPIYEELIQIANHGGYLSFYVGLEKDQFEGAIFNPYLLSKLSEFGIALEIDRHF